MLRLALVLIPTLLTIITPANSQTARPGGVEERCGWFDNPSPGNAWLHDRDGEWTVSIQGNHQAKGDWPPRFRPEQWVRSGNANYGFGCACLTGSFDPAEGSVLEVVSSRSRDLKTCRKEPSLSGIERNLR